MGTDIFEIEKTYQTKDIAEMLGFESVTIRKYSHALEQFGYEFDKNGDRRVFKHSDLAVLQQLKYMKEKTGMTLNATAEIVVMKHTESKSDYPTNSVALQTHESRDNGNLMQYDEQYMNRSISHILKQNEQILELLDRERKEKEKLQSELSALREEVDRQGKETRDRLDTFNERMEKVMLQRDEKKSVWKKLFR